MAFFFKKLLGSLLMPMPLGFLLLFVAVAMVWRGYRKAGHMITVVLLCWFVLSLSPVATALLQPLEFAHPKFSGERVDAVIVLGGYHQEDMRIPQSSVLSATSLNRLVEGIVILQAQPWASLALSGYAGRASVSNARAMADTAVSLGLAPSRIVLAETPKDTAEEAAHWARVLRGQRVALVTSATHMPRAVYLFEQQDMTVIPAPTRYLSAENDWSWRSWIPDARNLDYVAQAWHEYLGLFWAKINA